MRYKIIFAAALAAAMLLNGCEQASMPSPSPTQTEPDVSPSASVSSSGPAQPKPDVSPSESTSSSGPGQPEPDVSPSGPVSPDPGRTEPTASLSDPGQTEPAASASAPASGTSAEPAQTPAGSGTTVYEESLLAACDSADWSWFDDAVFIGDSVSFKLQNYVAAQRKNDPGFFGGAQFLTSLSLGSGNALWEVSDKSVHPAYRGEKMRLEKSVPLTGAKKVYMMLGMNDIAVYGINGAVENYCKLMDLILENAPGVEFYIQSVTPICQGRERGSPNNANLVRYNAALEQMCRERGIHFVDVAQVMRDASGCLPRQYCVDPDEMGIHVTDLACRVWLGYLSKDAQGQGEAT